MTNTKCYINELTINYMVKGKNKQGQLRAIFKKKQNMMKGNQVSSRQLRRSVSAKSGIKLSKGIKSELLREINSFKVPDIVSKLKPDQVEAHISPIPGIVDLTARWDLKRQTSP